ncbi:MAG: hypothetical protein P9L92_17835 [Candidatus Electryonea clarkiae]|nr:hypothetical protein [Candidatus Electryonea clarkiae]MDP8287759.1 hypothetical protein [Candidatus Electryonea clarkiae]
MQFDNTKYEFTDRGKAGTIALVVGVIGLVLSAVGFFVDRSQFMFSWLTSFAFWVSIGFGGLFFVMLHHITNAKWSVTARRMAENIMVTLPWLLIFAIPVFIGMGDLYEWVEIGKAHHGEKQAIHLDLIETAHASEDTNHGNTLSEETHDSHSEANSGHVEHDDHAHQAHIDLVASKSGFLNVPFFVIRTLIYFAVWTIFAFALYRLSIKQDKPGFTLNDWKRFKVLSAPGIIAFAFTVTFAAFDWLMSLFPAWYSTIYGLYYFAGGLVGIMAFMIVVFVGLRKRGILEKEITIEHYHDLGKLLFAFMIVWAYFSFSQYLLIWYANIPEETIYYHNRWTGSWKAMTLIIVFGHFVIPFVLLMSRHVKRSFDALRFFAIWLLVMHWLDLYWNVMPVLHPESALPSWLDLTTMMGIGGIFLFIFWRNFTKHAVLAFNDPKLDESIEFQNI